MNSINPGDVIWSGENPGIYLKDDERPQLPWGTLSLFFRIVLSPHGAGRAMLVLGAPDVVAGYPQVANFCITDNLPMARYLADEFVTQFGAFRNMPALQGMSWHTMTDCATQTDGKTMHSETLRAPGIEASMNWHSLHAPFAADVAPAVSATGAHQMYSVFRGADRGNVVVNGKPLPGRAVERDFLGGRLSSAFLAFAESWVAPRKDQA